MHTCKSCKETKSKENFARISKRNKFIYCLLCWKDIATKKKHIKNNTEKQLRLTKFRPALLKYFKLKPCMDCNVQYPSYSMQYDHRPGEKKCFELSRITSISGLSILQLLDELKKCDVVCANCHAKRTVERQLPKELFDDYDSFLKIHSFYGKTFDELYNEYSSAPSDKLLAGRKVRAAIGTGKPKPEKRKVVRPTKEELEKLVWEKATVKIAQELGVSDKAVEKWCKSYGISKPPRGYWAKFYSKDS